MKPSYLFPCMRLSAAKSPVTCVGQVSRFSVGTILAVGITLVACSAASPVASAQTVTYAGSGAVNFGSANVCLSGKTTPAPCSQTMTLSYTVTASGTLGTPQALTLGAPNLDYKLASGSTCSGSVIQGNSCTVKVTFAPIAPGARNGAVEIVDGSGKVLATTYLYGSGTGPRATFNPPTRRTIGGSSLTFSDVAVDGSGNLFIISGASVEELLAVSGTVPANPVIKVLATPTDGFFPNLSSLTVDGAGNVYFAVRVYPYGGYVEQMLAADGYATINMLAGGLDGPGNFSAPFIAVDGSGNVFVANTAYGDDSAIPGNNYEILAAGGYTTVKTLAGENPGYPQGIAIDAKGNLFIVRAEDGFAGIYTGEIIELTPTDGYITSRTISLVNVSASPSPGSIAIDPAGDLLVGLSGASYFAELLAVNGVLPFTPAVRVFPQAPPPAGQFSGTFVVFDDRGNLYLGNASPGLQELQLSTPSSFHFATTEVGYASSDSPKFIQVQNQGNATLDVTNVSVSTNWERVTGSGTPEDCSGGLSLASSALCNLDVSFKPTEAGALTGALEVTDNSLNAPGSTQSSTLRGTGITTPNITSVNTTYGAPYSVIILKGTNFGATQGSSTVTFNGIATPHYHWSDTQIYVTVPPNATTGNIVLTVGGVASNPIAFAVVPLPVITGMSPTSGPVGTTVSLTGQNLLDYKFKPTVTFNGKAVDFDQQSSTDLRVLVPTGATSGYFHVLINNTGMNTPIFTVTK
jgi:hypothetical protein